MVRFYEKNVDITTKTVWEVEGKRGNIIGVVRYNRCNNNYNGGFGFVPNSTINGITPETLQQIADFIVAKDELLER